MNTDGSENDAAILNGMSGHIGHYYVNVHKLGMLTPERWMRDFKESFAANAYRDMQWFAAQEAQAQQVQETATQANDIAAQLVALQEQLGDALTRIDELEQEKKAANAPQPKRKPRKAKVTEAEEPVDDEPVDDETPEEPETEDDATEDASEEA